MPNNQHITASMLFIYTHQLSGLLSFGEVDFGLEVTV